MKNNNQVLAFIYRAHVMIFRERNQALKKSCFLFKFFTGIVTHFVKFREARTNDADTVTAKTAIIECGVTK